MGTVAERTWWCPMEGQLTHAGSTIKQILSSVGGLLDREGVLHMLHQNRHH
uniref:Conotoxin superfamily W n=1 Tax=Conus ermineus TaxID=55423 RepID=A0A346CJF7_CONER|nr:conotoxin superfamily W [Conus ermineus]